jgi:SAM-dependent methyltransferase
MRWLMGTTVEPGLGRRLTVGGGANDDPVWIAVKPEAKREDWNRRYAVGDRIRPTAAPNRFLIAETTELPPARALDLACGAGKNAVWLAERGWRVTAVDFSDVALAMARDLASSRHVEVDWVQADVVTWTPAARAYDLVCVLYLQLPAPERRFALAHAADALAQGGTLLVVGHDLLNLTEGWGGPKQADVLFTPEDITRELDGLEIEKAERVRRPVEEGGVIHEAIDALVRARRP